ncbi:hypothetical protein BDA99DRAFT_540749 [Phascolomyces articulosus]|uniref:Uncharacterized protein n=1 Tax=Phascolomyces articulosus TaxID=60185 RepID=A0AAD5K461_9FUNG|nr:hypothetical protein BDA99DRAFT_540749 [Phascolomyces articulosus]
MEFIQSQVEKSLTWRNIKHMLRLDKDVLEKNFEDETYDNIPQSLRVNYQHVYYAMKRLQWKIISTNGMTRYNKKMGTSPADTEIVAINKGYNTVNDDISPNTYTDNVKILICHWHIIKAWKKNILFKLTTKSSNPSKILREKREMREKALSLKMNMMKAELTANFDLEHERFETWCVDIDEEWDGPQLYLYFEREFFPKREKWSHA